MVFQISQYLKFLLKSTNAHGVHSPFVYNLVTKCFYNNTTFKTSKTVSKKEKLLLKITDYFKFKNNIRISELDNFIENSNTYDVVVFNKNHKKEITLKHFTNLLPTIHNDSVFVFDAIHNSEENMELWETIKQHPQVIVTIDTFYLGLVFFRKEQAKEHFAIRV